MKKKRLIANGSAVNTSIKTENDTRNGEIKNKD
jgi:hypothetical protein